ncbi:MAG: extracellular solute-binding protein [Eubacteriales bacterium]|nr:extracellular solute-binding protein [Eubacteriales bacterium]
MMRRNFKRAGIMLAAMGMLMSGSTAFAEEQVTLEMFNMKTEIVDILNGLIEEYEAENPNVTISLNTPSDAPTVLSTRMASDDTPDIFTVWPKASFFEQVDAGYVMNLADTGCMDNINETAREQWLYNGGEYAATISYNFAGIWYNKAIFEECGITEFPNTMEGLKEVCATLTEKGYTPFVVGAQKTDQTVQHCYLSMASYFNDEEYAAYLEDLNAKQVNLEDSVYAQCFAEVGTVLSEIAANSQDDILGYDDSAAVADFANGKAAMMIDGTWKLPAILAANPEMDCGIAAIPGETAEDTRVAAYPGDFSLCASASLEGAEKEAALDFIKWMTSTETATKYAEADGSPSCIIGVDYVADQFREIYDTYLAAGNFILNPDCKWNSAQITAVGAAVQEVYYNKDAENFTANIQEALNNN